MPFSWEERCVFVAAYARQRDAGTVLKIILLTDISEAHIIINMYSIALSSDSSAAQCLIWSKPVRDCPVAVAALPYIGV